MPLSDLSRVTEVLAETLRLNITQRIDPGLAGQLNVSTLPPERVTGEMNTINLYLYHLVEDAQRRNLPGNLGDRAPSATKPMTLVLYYILTTHHEVQSIFDTLTEQRLMGYALKTLHDFAVIDDRSEIGGTQLLPDDLRNRDNGLEVSLRQVGPDESVAFWSAEDRSTARLSAYLEVRYAQLEPEPPSRLPGIVLSIGTFVVDIASPQLAGSRSRLVFTLPAIAGGGTQTIQAAPARVGPLIPAIPGSNRLMLVGTSLGVGRRRQVLLSNDRWRVRAPDLPRVPLDPSLPQNVAAGWEVSERAGAIEIVMGTELTADGPGGPVTLPVEPGNYSASVHVVKDSEVILGQLKEITDRSNAIPFGVIPRATGFAVVNAADRRIRIDLDASTDLTPPTGPGLPGALDILLVVAGEAYLRHDPAAPGTTFDIGDFEPSGSTIDFRARFDPAVAGTYAVRVIVEGAESQPFWIELP